jgi:hypothetical protein
MLEDGTQLDTNAHVRASLSQQPAMTRRFPQAEPPPHRYVRRMVAKVRAQLCVTSCNITGLRCIGC